MSDDLSFFFPELDPANEGFVPLPPAEVRILDLKAEPVIDDGPTRLRVYIETTAFQKRPHMEVILADSRDEEIASANIIEPISRKNVFTLHLKGQQSGKFSLHARLYYPDGIESDTRSTQFEI